MLRMITATASGAAVILGGSALVNPWLWTPTEMWAAGCLTAVGVLTAWRVAR